MKFWPGLILIIVVAFALVAGLVLTTGYFIDDNPTTTIPLLDVTISGIQVIIVGVAAMCIAVFLFACVVGYPWPWIRRELCSDCHVKKTRDKDKDGFRVCEDCAHERWKKELIQKAEEKAAGQPHLRCPKDGTIMGKLVLRGTSVVADNCEVCGRIVLEKEESEELETKLNQPRGGGSFSGGMMLGMSLGRMG